MVSVTDIRIALAHPNSLMRYAIAYVRKYSRLARFLHVSVEEIKRLYVELYADPFFAEMRAKSDSVGAPLHAGMLSPLQAPALYVMARVTRPQIVVETGVANGWSTSFILKALERNDAGRLYSIDIPNAAGALLPEGKTTGWVVPNALKTRWDFIPGDTRVELPRLLLRLQTIDFFFHDSDHSYEMMTFEFRTAWPHLRPGGLLISDDIRDNNAFNDFVHEVVPATRLTLSTLGGLRKTGGERS